MSDLTDRARAWAAEDPDEHTRAELETLVAAAETDPAAAADLADRFDGRLEFGTAGPVSYTHLTLPTNREV